jgi:N-acylneuraminate cytidylyltransferase
VGDKPAVLQAFLDERKLDPQHVVYLGNDVNDLPCFSMVGCAVTVADAHQEILARADLVLARAGGKGAVRELCDRIIRSRIPLRK